MKKFILLFCMFCLVFPGKYINAEKKLNNNTSKMYSRNSVAVNEDRMILYYSPASNMSAWWKDMYVDGKYSYCLKFEDLIQNTNDHQLNDPLQVYSEKDWNKFTLFAMYGERRYEQTGDIKYRYAAQALIHGHFLPNGQKMRFYSFHSGQKVEFDVNNHRNEITSLYETHSKLPNLPVSLMDFKVGDSYKLTDSNKVLNKYNVVSTSDKFKLKKDGNVLQVDILKAGSGKFSLKNDLHSKKGEVLFWTSSKFQDLITVTSFTPAEVEYTISSTEKFGRLEIHKLDSESKELIGPAKFVLRKLEGENYIDLETFVVDKIYERKNLKLGKYQLEEITAPTGYSLSSTKYDFEITKDKQFVLLEVENTKEVQIVEPEEPEIVEVDDPVLEPVVEPEVDSETEAIIEVETVPETLPKTGLNYSVLLGLLTFLVLLCVIRLKPLKN